VRASRYLGAERLLRVLGIVLVAAVAEELIFRGALFTRLERTRLRAGGAAAVTAASSLRGSDMLRDRRHSERSA
jgi:hypothetical protein